MVARFGELISQSTQELIQSIEIINKNELCKGAIELGICQQEDIPTFLFNQLYFLPVTQSKGYIKLLDNRLGFDIPTTNPIDEKIEWLCVYANQGITLSRVGAKSMLRDLVQSMYVDMAIHKNELEQDRELILLTIARIIDGVHVNSQLQAAILTSPKLAGNLIRKKLENYGYFSMNEMLWDTEGSQINADTAKLILERIAGRLINDLTFYFEFTAPDKSAWIAGITLYQYMNEFDNFRYPGQDEYSMGIASNGSVYYNGKVYEYIEDPHDPLFYMGFRTWGLTVDIKEGTMCLVINGKNVGTAFGQGAKPFPPEIQNQQAELIRSNSIVPMIAVKADQPQSVKSFLETISIRVNFGLVPFTYPAQAMSFNSFFGKVGETISKEINIVDRVGKSEDEEETRTRLAIEKGLRLQAPESEQSFSKFPPNIFKRSVAAIRIQRVYRRFKGRLLRKKMYEDRLRASITIQRMARKKLRNIRHRKNIAANIIQHAWRRKKFIWLALMVIKYQQPLPELHRSAKTIQSNYRRWIKFKRSPLSILYNRKKEELDIYARKIQKWWLVIYGEISRQKLLNSKKDASRVVQRYWRGYQLRKMLRPDLRQRLHNVGAMIFKFRKELLRIQAVYCIQRCWKNYKLRKVRLNKVRTRHKAATKIQSIWKGFWVRSHIHLHFNYGERIYLSAVRKCLQNCHFIIKMYRPCGLVCPK